MPKTNIYNQQGEQVGEIELSDKVFGVKANEALVHQAFVAQMANERQVLAHTKTRAEVSGGGKKPWKQKGTGRARVGSSRSPIWIGGGVVFGPTNARNFSKKINKKMKQKAMFMALSDKVASDSIVVLDKFEIGEFKTKIFNDILKSLMSAKLDSRQQTADSRKTKELKQGKRKKEKRSVLVVNDAKDEKTKYSGRNLAGVKMMNLENINLVDLLKYRDLVLTKGAVEGLEKKYK